VSATDSVADLGRGPVAFRIHGYTDACPAHTGPDKAIARIPIRTLIGSLHSSIKLTRIPRNSSPICLAFGGETFVKLVQLHARDLAFPIQDAETTLANAFG
jgi:hypothetical protein